MDWLQRSNTNRLRDCKTVRWPPQFDSRPQTRRRWSLCRVCSSSVSIGIHTSLAARLPRAKRSSHTAPPCTACVTAKRSHLINRNRQYSSRSATTIIGVYVSFFVYFCARSMEHEQIDRLLAAHSQSQLLPHPPESCVAFACSLCKWNW